MVAPNPLWLVSLSEEEIKAFCSRTQYTNKTNFGDQNRVAKLFSLPHTETVPSKYLNLIYYMYQFEENKYDH